VEAESDAVDTAMAEMCWRVPSTVTQPGALMDCPHLAAALQAGSGICISLSWTTPSPVLHAWVQVCFTPLGIASIAAWWMRRGEISHPVSVCSFRSGGTFASQQCAAIPGELPSTPGKGGRGFGMLLG